MFVVALAAAAFAGPPLDLGPKPDSDDDFEVDLSEPTEEDKKKKGEFEGAFAPDEEDEPMFDEPEDEPSSFAAPVKRLPTVSLETPALSLETAGKTALADNFPVQIVNTAAGAVVAELPVLVAMSASEVDAPFTLIGVVNVDGQKIAEIRHLITSASVSASGPSFVFLKAFAPVPAVEGTVEFVVSRQDGTEPVVLYRRSTRYGDE
jgi:hypothetical protein